MGGGGFSEFWCSGLLTFFFFRVGRVGCWVLGEIYFHITTAHFHSLIDLLLCLRYYTAAPFVFYGRARGVLSLPIL